SQLTEVEFMTLMTNRFVARKGRAAWLSCQSRVAWKRALSVLVFAALALSFTDNLAGRFTKYRHAYNKHDKQAVLSFFADDYEFKVANSSYKASKKDIAGLLDWDFATNAHSTYGDVQFKGNMLSAVITEQNDFYQYLGIPERQYQFTYTYNDD